VPPSLSPATLSEFAYAVLSVLAKRLQERPLSAASQTAFSVVAFAGAHCSPRLAPLWWLPPAFLFVVYLCSRLFHAREVDWLDISFDTRLLLAVLTGFMLHGLSLELFALFLSLRRTLP